jgi:trehalose 6-phosphate phosphatase
MLLRPLKPENQPVMDRVVSAGRLLVMFDFDGVLAPLESNLDAAGIPPTVRECVSRLECDDLVTLGIISGRSLNDLIPRAQFDRVVYAGNHGNEIRGLGLRFMEPLAFISESALQDLVSTVTFSLADMPHILVENKRLTATVHMRAATADERTEVTARVVTEVHKSARFRSKVGRNDIDILPDNGWHKGTAAQWIRHQLGLEDALLIYAGDDASDEDVFAAFPGEITIKVGPGPTQASYVADSPDELWAFVAQMGAMTALPR